ncbi:acyl carrier protein [Streptomyces alkaliterrae]|uniref:Acyl carrier protein n=1 Tax=Streptomyces alkaliterrae TaxID=2213162 RepID=A0A5P0YMN4_9ACTN|nr:acyl carrier protein [Streptomyces alkaliterrae]MBB1253383.1 acyl carrier protein [Streptomyces alkaliterrae]MBB1259177.1 acyl carrier protein [Streptomyces alkaliterrae]MQS01593.1 acyl carrier protein [Streptomyces alkaliterrae]
MSSETLTDAARSFADDVVRQMLQAVGIGQDALTGGDVLTQSFEDLGLDSLARVEMASRIQDRFGVDVEEELTGDTSPAELQRLVNTRLDTKA